MESPKTVLVVDDHPQVLALIARTLSGAGYRTLMASGAVPALRLLNQEQPDLMIVDVHLPGMNGLELVELLRGDGTRFTPAIAITGDTQMDPDEVQARGFVALLRKPFTLQELRRAVANYIG